MKNIDKIRAMSAEELGAFLSKAVNQCSLCNYQDISKCSGNCEKGITQWLNKKYIEPMPELEAGDIVKTHYAEYVAIGGAVIVNPITYVRKFLGELDGHIRFIYRYNGAEKEYEEIWRDDDK